MNTIKYSEALKTYQRIDLYRAKYRHDDFTPHAWCFHGNKVQGWAGECKSGFLTFVRSTTYTQPISIDASIYKYVSFKFQVPNFVPYSKEYRVKLTYTANNVLQSKEVSVRWDEHQRQYTAFIDMSSDGEWTGTVTTLKLSVLTEAPQALIENGVTKTIYVWREVSNEIYCEYIKVDKENVFANVLDSKTSTIVDFNQMRDDVEEFAKQAIPWEGANRVSQFINTIKKSDIDQVNQKITSLAPYNGCATCDSYTCACDNLTYGRIECQACNSCNQFQSCATCDITCHEQARSCSCDTRCFSQATSCTCDDRCYGYSSCSCDSSCHSCYSGNTVCSACNSSCNSQALKCPCNTSCYDYDCRYQHKDKETLCSFCYVGCDVATEYEGCRTYSNGTCSCNASCHLYKEVSGELYCEPTCFVQRCSCNGGDSSRNYWECSSANSVWTRSCQCYSGYGRSSCSSCNSSCYSQATSCSCDTICYTQARSCSCDKLCNGYQACLTCDGCDLYRECACNATCHQEACAQCHKTNYSTVQI